MLCPSQSAKKYLVERICSKAIAKEKMVIVLTEELAVVYEGDQVKFQLNVPEIYQKLW